MIRSVFKPFRDGIQRSTRLCAQRRTLFCAPMTETHQMIRDTCRDFVERELKPEAARIDKEEAFPKEQIKKLGELGLLSMLTPTEYGGSGSDTLSYAISLEELSRGCASIGIITSVHNFLYMEFITKFGTEKQKQEWVAPFATGERVGSFSLTEPGVGSDPGSMKTTAKIQNDKIILNGEKAWITNVLEAEASVVLATFDRSKKHKGINAYLVPMPTKGLSRPKNEDKLGIRGSSTGPLILEDVEIPRENQIGKDGEAFKMAMMTLDGARIGIAAQAIGIGQAALECAIDYTGKRQCFNQPIHKFQAIQFKLAEMEMKLQSARHLTYHACYLRDQGKRFTKEVSLAKCVASEASTFCAHQAIQILGAMGYVRDMPAERYYRDARVTELYGGTNEVQRVVIASNLLKEYGVL